MLMPVVETDVNRGKCQKVRLEIRFFEKKAKNICVCEKKVVILHDFSCIVEWSVWVGYAYGFENERIICGGGGFLFRENKLKY